MKKTRRENRSQSSKSAVPQARRNIYSVSEILPGILSQYGIGRSRPEDDLNEHWMRLAGTLASETFVLGLRRGILEIGAANAIVIQELSFRKYALLKKLQNLYPDGNIRDIRFRIEKKETQEQ